MMGHLGEALDSWARSNIIASGIQEDVADMYVERVRHELKDPRLQLVLKAYVFSLFMFIIDGT